MVARMRLFQHLDVASVPGACEQAIRSGVRRDAFLRGVEGDAAQQGEIPGAAGAIITNGECVRMMPMPIVDPARTWPPARRAWRAGERRAVAGAGIARLFVARGREYRSEFHVNPSDEVMLMVKGDMRLHYRTPDGKEDVALVPEWLYDHLYAGRHAAFAALPARRLPAGDRTPAAAGRGRPVPVVLPEVRRAAARGKGRSARLSRRPGVEGLCSLLRQRSAPHLQVLRPPDAAAVRGAASTQATRS